MAILKSTFLKFYINNMIINEMLRNDFMWLIENVIITEIILLMSLNFVVIF